MHLADRLRARRGESGSPVIVADAETLAAPGGLARLLEAQVGSDVLAGPESLSFFFPRSWKAPVNHAAAMVLPTEFSRGRRFMFGSGPSLDPFSTLKVAIVVGALKLASRPDIDMVQRLRTATAWRGSPARSRARAVDGPPAEPLITGSLGDLVRDARLDPLRGTDRAR